MLQKGEMAMRARCGWPWITILVAAAAMRAGGSVGAQELDTGVAAARTAVAREIVRGLPPELPAGALATLPPEVAEQRRVAKGVLDTWTVEMAKVLHELRPKLKLAERGRLEDVLREQKFGDSAYADPTTAVAVGKLVAARTLLVTRLHRFEPNAFGVDVALEAALIDVETGENLWALSIERMIVPLWLRIALVLGLLLLAVVAARAWDRRRRRQLVHEEIPGAKDEVRLDVDGLARAATDARERARAAGCANAAARLQESWVELDAALDRVRHALPGGAVERNPTFDLVGAAKQAGRISELLQDLKKACSRFEGSERQALALAEELRAGAGTLREAVDTYKRELTSRRRPA